MPPRLFRRGPVVALIFGTSAFGGAAYRWLKPSSSLNPHDFTPYTLIDKQRVSSTSSVFTLRHSEDAASPESISEVWKRGVWSLQVKQPQLQIARAYTPLPPKPETHGEDGDDVDDIRLLIRQEQGGEVSTYLHRLPDLSTIELRGPHVECELPQDVKEVIFLAGGTGIAPAMQVAQALGQAAGTRMSVLWANRRREECVGGVGDVVPTGDVQNNSRGWKNLFGLMGQSPAQMPAGAIAHETSRSEKGVIVQELEALKTQSKARSNGLEVQYYVDEDKTFIKASDVATRLQAQNKNEGGSKIILVSGPEGFIEYWAGKKVWTGGREVQGPLGGVLGQMDLNGWRVIKL
ncbi:unnamed protein product [Periconia digitata]|uniref:FAD-binding FR-type domain-containing protein n=1 Tax=Periconia digitata TaxID=1303443 RepID=A0A9W4UFM8_9PLEO|nr:unnamed protein product [Periconia digitata]